MEVALKKEAEEYFKQHPSIQELPQTFTTSQQYNRLYLLLIARYLGTDELFKNILSMEKNNSIRWDAVLESIWSYSLSIPEKSSQFRLLASLVGEIDRKGMVDRGVLLKSLPESLTVSAQIIKQDILLKKSKRTYTKFYYEQNKYNLMRESNEGYAKLSLLLLTVEQTHNVEIVWNKILSIVGNFDLDPDRLLDMIIECFCQGKCSEIYENLMIKFNRQSLTTILGNKILKDTTVEQSQLITFVGPIQIFLGTNIETLWKQNGFLPKPKLIHLIGTLIKRGYIQVEDIFSYLNPSDTFLQQKQLEKLDFGRDRVFRTFRMVMDEMDEAEKARKKQEDNLKFMGQLLHSSKLALITELVKVNDWERFTKLWSYYKEKVDLLIYQPLLFQLCQLLEWLIDPIFQRISLSSNFTVQTPQNNSFNYDPSIRTLQMQKFTAVSKQFYDSVSEVLGYIGPYIGFKCALFIKLCRIFKKITKQPEIFIFEENTHTPQLKAYGEESIKKILYHYLIPGISYQEENPVIANEAFQLLQLFPYKFRFSCYCHVYTETMTNNPYVAYIFENVKNKQNIIVNNLSKDNKKTFLKKMAKLTHNQALQTFYWIFRRLIMEDYEAVVSQIVAALNNCTLLTLQMSIFVTLYCLTEQKQPALNFKTGEQNAWFKNLIIYLSHFYRKYLETDIEPVFDYIMMKVAEPIRDLEDNEEIPGAPLKLLDSLLKKTVGDFVLQQVNKSKYEIIAAGPRMNFEARILTTDIRAAKKSKVTLEAFFWEKTIDKYNGLSLAINLLVTLTQKRAQVLHKSYISNIKLIGDIYDDFSSAIIQFIRVLNYQTSSYSHYAKLLPENALDELITKYKLPLQIAFEIIRPSSKHISSMDTNEWGVITNQVQNVIQNYVKMEEKYVMGYEVHDNLRKYLTENFEKVDKMFSKNFLTTFWMLTLDSIYFPSKIYSDKIDDLKKKIEQSLPRRNSDKNERQMDRAKTLYEKLVKEEEQQKNKMKETMHQSHIFKFEIQFIKNSSTGEKGTSGVIPQFAEVFVQVCLLPRMLLDSSEALYCMKFTVEVIKANKLSSSKSIKLLTFIIEYVMNYLPYATEREATKCLAIFLSEILGIFINWNDSTKLQQDMKRILGIEENLIKDNYPKLKEYLLKLYERVGNMIKSIKDEPYIIKNCLYMLEKVDSIPSYKQQAEQLEDYLKELKEQHTTVDMQTILERQITIISNKKQNLPQKMEDARKKISPSAQAEAVKKPSLQNKAKEPEVKEKITSVSNIAPEKEINKLNGNKQSQKPFENQSRKQDSNQAKHTFPKQSSKKAEENLKKSNPEQKQHESIDNKPSEPKIKTVKEIINQNIKKTQSQKPKQTQKYSAIQKSIGQGKSLNLSQSQKNQELRLSTNVDKTPKHQTIQFHRNLETKKEKLLQEPQKTNKFNSFSQNINEEEKKEKPQKQNEQIVDPPIRTVREAKVSLEENRGQKDKKQQKDNIENKGKQEKEDQKQDKKNNYKSEKYSQERNEPNRNYNDRYKDNYRRNYQQKYKKEDYRDKNKNSQERRHSKQRMMNRRQGKYDRDRRHEKNRSRSREKQRDRHYRK